MNKRLLIILIIITTIFIPSSAVLKEKNIDNTLSVLRTELTNYHENLERQSGFMKEQQKNVRENLINTMNKSNQNSLMLYSQKQDFIFDLAYTCHEATEQYSQYRHNITPFRAYIEKATKEIARFDSLINNLRQMPKMMLSEKAKIDRNVCLTLAVNIRRTLKDNSEQFSEYIQYYNMTEQHLLYLNDYANKIYSDIQQNIFSNGTDNYLTILSNLGRQINETQDTISDKYKPQKRVKSQWDVRIILFLFTMIFLYAFIAFLINILFIRYLIPKRFRTESFMAKRTCITLATSVVTLALLLGLIRMIFKEQNFIIMASNLLVEYTWLLGVILISLLLRLKDSQIKSAFKIYSPLIFIGFIVISFRIILIPNDLVNLVFPAIILVCMIWQWSVIRRHNKNVPKSDVFFTYFSLCVFVVSVICSWIGFTLMSVQLIIWWIMQLTCILTITCIKGYLKKMSERKGLNTMEKNQTWLFDLVNNVVLPVMGVLSVIIAIYWAADVFNLSDTTMNIFKTPFINSGNFRVSIQSIAIVIVLFFVFSYINTTTIGLLKVHFDKKDHKKSTSQNVMARNVVQVLVWGIWLIISLTIFHVSNTWLVVISGGLSTGVGFASKDILENIYYGISLMAGRINIGDYIICDGTRGRVSSISYTSTMIEAVDGSVIAFQNSQLFTKNYKNMTKNHGYELDILEVGVAYGSDIDKVKALLEEALMQLECINKKRGVKIVMNGFGDSSITLKILVWVSVFTHYYDDGTILECVYKTLNANKIEIPFPQCDVHIKHASYADETAK